jgi:hypothetical protein
MAQKKQTSRRKLPGADIREIPEGVRTKILGSCANLKEPARSRCISQHSRSFREDWTREQKKKLKKGRIA